MTSMVPCKMLSRLVVAMVVMAAFLVSPPLSHSSSAAQDVQGRAQAAMALRSSVVLKAGGKAFCSGVFSTQAEVLTAAHCVVGRKEFVVEDSGEVTHVVARVSWVDRPRDLAIVALDMPASSARIPRLADSVGVGEAVWLAGAPAPDGNALGLMVTRGVVARIAPAMRFRNADAQSDLGTAVQQVLFLDVRGFFGSSGGAVFNDSGEVVGVVVRVHFAEAVVPIVVRVPFWLLAVGLETLKEGLR